MSSASPSFYSMGSNTYRVPTDLFESNRSRVMEQLQTAEPHADCFVYMVGGREMMRYDSDHEPIFRQESYFWYLTGVKEPDCQLIMDISQKKTILLIPQLPESYATIMGEIKTPAQWKAHYCVDEVRFTSEADMLLQECLERRTTSTNKLLLMKGVNSDSGSMYLPPKLHPSLQEFVDDETLFPILAESRVVKSSQELALIQHVTEVTSFAHAYVMRNMKPGMMEYQGESLFRHYCYFNYGCRLTGYTPICGCGPNAAVLHYG